MDLFDAIKGRRSVRRFLDKEVSDEDLRKILGCAIMAPSAGNIQPWEFIIVKGKEAKAKLAKAALGQMFIAEAPVVVVVCANERRSSLGYGERGRRLYCLQDTAAAIENMLLAIFSLGLGACWVGAFHEDEASRVLNIPSGVRPVAIIPIGYPAEVPEPRSRRPLESVVHYERFGEAKIGK